MLLNNNNGKNNALLSNNSSINLHNFMCVFWCGVVWPNDPSSATGPAATPERKEDVR
jgi:hypothetical protein